MSEVSTQNGFIARVSAKDGRPLFIGPVFPSRDEAAAYALLIRPKAKRCSTSRAHGGRETGFDIRWHERSPL